MTGQVMMIFHGVVYRVFYSHEIFRGRFGI